jgi:hypothetical protein
VFRSKTAAYVSVVQERDHRLDSRWGPLWYLDISWEILIIVQHRVGVGGIAYLVLCGPQKSVHFGLSPIKWNSNGTTGIISSHLLASDDNSDTTVQDNSGTNAPHIAPARRRDMHIQQRHKVSGMSICNNSDQV